MAASRPRSREPDTVCGPARPVGYLFRVVMRALEPKTARTASDAIRYVMWPLAIMTMLHRILIKAVNRYITDDFRPVYDAAVAFWNRQPVYTADYGSVDPHYLYPPSGTLLIAPFAVLNPENSRWLFVGVNTIAIVVALYIILRMFGYGLTSVAAPILLFGAFASETVTNTLVFTNINGVVLLGEVLFLWLVLKNRQWAAGIAIGLTLAVKPLLAPLLLIPLVYKQWRTIGAAIVVPVLLTALAIPWSVDAGRFVTATMPYLMTTRDYFNSAIVGNGLYYGLPEWLILGMRALFAVLVAISLWLLWRYYREDRLFFVVTTSGLLLLASYLLSSLGQMYYSMTLFPLLMSVVLRNSVMRNWPAWLAVYGFLSYDSWLSGRFYTAGRAAEYMRVSFGWSLLIIVIFAVLVGRYLAAKRQGRLDSGIDPLFDDEPVADSARAAGIGSGEPIAIRETATSTVGAVIPEPDVRPTPTAGPADPEGDDSAGRHRAPEPTLAPPQPGSDSDSDTSSWIEREHPGTETRLNR